MTTDQEKGLAPEGWTRRVMKGIPASFEAFWTRREEDGFRYGVELDERHCNAQGFVHGGLMMSIMDHVLSLKIWEASDRSICSTVHLDCHFMAPLRAPCFIELDTEIMRQGKKMAFLRGILKSGDKDIMEATGVWSIMPVPKKD